MVVSSDLVGSTALRSRVGEAVMDKLRRRHEAGRGAGGHGPSGAVVKLVGDGIMAAFAPAAEAADAVGAPGGGPGWGDRCRWICCSG